MKSFRREFGGQIAEIRSEPSVAKTVTEEFGGRVSEGAAWGVAFRFSVLFGTLPGAGQLL